MIACVCMCERAVTYVRMLCVCGHRCDVCVGPCSSLSWPEMYVCMRKREIACVCVCVCGECVRERLHVCVCFACVWASFATSVCVLSPLFLGLV